MFEQAMMPTLYLNSKGLSLPNQLIKAFPVVGGLKRLPSPRWYVGSL